METGLHCLVGSLLAQGLFNASDVAKPQSGCGHSGVLGCRSNDQCKRKLTAAFQGGCGKESRESGNPRCPRQPGALSCGCVVGEWLEAANSQAVMDTGSF